MKGNTYLKITPSFKIFSRKCLGVK